MAWVQRSETVMVTWKGMGRVQKRAQPSVLVSMAQLWAVACLWLATV